MPSRELPRRSHIRTSGSDRPRYAGSPGAHAPRTRTPTSIRFRRSARIKQVAVGKNHGALPSRLHMRSQVVGRSLTRLIVQFDGENELVGIRPHLVRVLQQQEG